jgi:hypothetical protein
MLGNTRVKGGTQWARLGRKGRLTAEQPEEADEVATDDDDDDG